MKTRLAASVRALTSSERLLARLWYGRLNLQMALNGATSCKSKNVQHSSDLQDGVEIPVSSGTVAAECWHHTGIGCKDASLFLLMAENFKFARFGNSHRFYAGTWATLFPVMHSTTRNPSKQRIHSTLPSTVRGSHTWLGSTETIRVRDLVF